MAHVPVRQCAGCRERKAQAAMRRFVRDAGGWRADGELRSSGRGVYLCSAACVARAEKNRRYPGLASVAAEYVFDLRNV